MTKFKAGNRFTEVRPLVAETPIMGTTAEQVQACFAGEVFARNLQRVVAKIEAREAREAAARETQNSQSDTLPNNGNSAK